MKKLCLNKKQFLLSGKTVFGKVLAMFLCVLLVVPLLSGVGVKTVNAAEPGEPGLSYESGLNYDQYPALKDVYKDYFMMGTTGKLGDVKSELVGFHFDTYTPENEMKPENVYTKGTKDFNFGQMENLLAQMEAGGLSGMNMIGHTLAWHSQSPDWLWDAPNFNKETAIANLETHIEAVMEEYGAGLAAMDVVNEAIGSADSSWKVSVNEKKGTGWCLALGSDWIEQVFLKAAEIVDENGWDCKLYYNDFGLDSAVKAQLVYDMVKEINEKNEGTRPNGKLLIEGIGMQGHYTKNTKLEDVEASIRLFAELEGVSLSFTELDIEWNAAALTHEQAVQQGARFAGLFQIFKKYAAGPGNTTENPKIIERVTFWGFNDGDTWKNLPVLFNAPSKDGTEITGKEALVAVLEPDAYIEINPIEYDEVESGSVDGVHVYATEWGDGWSGANIILGEDADAWPWSTAGEDDKVAFVPEQDAKYRISVDYTSLGTSGIRVRWVKDNENGSYTSGDNQVVGTSPHNTNLNPDQVATMIPAYFNSGMVSGESYTLVTEVTLDSNKEADGLIGNIAIRGGGGGNSFIINGIKVEKIGASAKDDKLLVNWPEKVPKAGTEGIHAFSTDSGDSWSGANIILGDNANVWPWSTAGADNQVAFVPEKDAKYRINVDYTSLGTNNVRIRWVENNENGGYTSKDNQVVGTPPYSNSIHANTVATTIPAYFNSGIVGAGRYNLVTEVILDGNETAGGLIGNIAIRGGGGGNSLLVNGITVEKIGGASDEPLVNWPDGFEANVVEVTNPGNARISGTKILASVANDVTSQEIDVAISDTAESWKLYSDRACTEEIPDKTMELEEGLNISYIKVTAPLGVEKIYTVKITRAILVEDIVLSDSSVSLKKGETKELVPTITPSDATNKNVSWNSSNENAATVSENGTVTAIATGTAIITVTTLDGNKEASCTVTVTNPATDLNVGATSKSMVSGDTYTLTAVPVPSDADGKVEFSSSDSAVASIDATGKITAKKSGLATVTAKIGSITKTCTITVTNSAAGLNLGATSKKMVIGDTYILTATPVPADADGKVEFSSSDSAVALVDATGKITAKKAGTATITAKIGSIAKTCTITVTKKALAKPTGLKLTEKKAEWKTVANNNGYTLTIKRGSKNVKTVQIAKGKTSYAIPKGLLKKGVAHTFTLKAKGNANYADSAVATSKKFTPAKKALAKPTGLKLTAKKAQWKAVKNNNGYTLKIMQGKKTIKTVQVKKGKTSYTIPKKLLKKGKTYFFTLKAKGTGDYKNSAVVKSKNLKIR